MLNCRSLIKIISVVTLLLTVIGCGAFKQRGSLVIPDYLTTVYLTPDDPYEPLQRRLRYTLQKKQVRIINYPSDGVTNIYVSKPIIGRDVLASGPSGQVQRFRLTISTNFRLEIKSEPKIERTITRSREVSINNDKLLANESAEQIIRNELLTEIVNELLRQFTTRPLDKASVLDSSTADNSPC